MQTKSLHTFDYLVFLVYFVIVAGYGYYIYHKKKKATTDSKDFFLAEGSLTWWAIGASLIASNISAEQFIGMSGNGFSIGLAISTYEWMAAATLIVVAVFFLPIYLKNKIQKRSHAIRKGPLLRRGEDPTRALFATEHITPREPDAAEIDVAKRTLAAIPFSKPLLYARVDLIRDDTGAPCVLELELTEPSLFFAHAPGSARRFARAIVGRAHT